MPTPDYASMIARIESGGRYDALGPITKGDRAYGKYQVMGANIPVWTERVLGQRLTPQQFLDNPQAQDQVFQSIFGGYVQKYGAPGAARAWFAGEKGMHNPNAKDILGTTVTDYERKFLGGQPSPAGPTPQAPQAPAGGLLGGPSPQQPQGLLGALASPESQQQQINPMMLAGLFPQAQPMQMPAIPPPMRRPIDMRAIQALAQQAPGFRGWSI